MPAGTAPTPATQCTDMGSTSCGTDGKCNGAGACRNYAAAPLWRRELHRIDAVVAAVVRRRGRLPGRDDQLVRPVSVRDHGVQDDVHQRRRPTARPGNTCVT